MPHTVPKHHRREVSRVEGFSDAVFAFAITLLVVSLEVPRTFDELLHVMRGFPAFAISFALLFQIWWRHYRFFRRYDLEDTTVIALTGVLLFVVLFFVYPLKFLWFLFLSQFTRDAVTAETITVGQVPLLFFVYGAGVVATFSVLAALYGHAYAQREELRLSPVEELDTRVDVYRNMALAGIGVLSIGVAAVTKYYAPRLAGLAGYVYFLIGVSEWLLGTYHNRQRERLTSSP
jgi:uncharacterized membrane protein